MNIENSKYLIEKFDLLNGNIEKEKIINYEFNNYINNTFLKEKIGNMKLLKFLNKEITYFKNDEKKETKNNVNTLSDKNYDYVEEKKNIIIKSDNGYVINDKIDKKKKFCFCCIPII